MQVESWVESDVAVYGLPGGVEDLEAPSGPYTGQQKPTRLAT